MTKIKFCGISRADDILFINELMPDYVGFVFWERSKRFISQEKAIELKSLLNTKIKSVGVFVNAELDKIMSVIKIIDVIQLHGDEDELYIKNLRSLTNKKIIKAFQIKSSQDADAATNSTADYIMLDSGKGTGKNFDWTLVKNISRPYFLAGGLNPENISEAIRKLNPFAVDVSSGIETDGAKDKSKMTAFINAVRKENLL